MSDAPAVPVLVDRFLAHLRVERALSPNTVRAYSADMARFLEWAERAGEDPLRLPPASMRRYLAEMDRARYSRRTIARRLSAVRSWYAYLRLTGVPAVDPAAVVATPKQASRLPRTVATDLLDALLDAPDPDTCAGMRDRAVLELLYATGCRVGEAAGLSLGDIDLASGQVRVTGKGDKQRILPLHPEAVRRLREYVDLPQPVGYPPHRRRHPPAHEASHGCDRRCRRPHAAYAEAHLRDAHARGGGRPPLGAGASRSRCAVHHPDLHSPRDAAAASGAPRLPSQGVTIIEKGP
jgi:integrase